MADLETVHATIDHTGITGVGGASFVGCKAYNDGTQSIPDNSSTAVTFGAEEFDTDGFHSTSGSTSRITIPTGKGGKYRFTYHFGLASSNTTGSRIGFLRKNGGTDSNNIIGSAIFLVPSASVASVATGVVEADLVAGDYVELFIYQNSGGAINLGSTLASDRGMASAFGCQFLG